MRYVARVSIDGMVRIYQVGRPQGPRPVTAIRLRPGADVIDALREKGWEPTGQRGPGGQPGAIYVQRTDA